ncbi:unnamed protein product [Paramecium sonneborni]|uniref:Uncharacterized protein n=1 Tax=Paramecium sonneborni TaxID=65129 RepID=A0A8S1RIH8_9CILI|nr:unnamed protein product [Paramecium sonneborni]
MMSILSLIEEFLICFFLYKGNLQMIPNQIYIHHLSNLTKKMLATQIYYHAKAQDLLIYKQQQSISERGNIIIQIAATPLSRVHKKIKIIYNYLAFLAAIKVEVMLINDVVTKKNQFQLYKLNIKKKDFQHQDHKQSIKVKNFMQLFLYLSLIIEFKCLR